MGFRSLWPILLSSFLSWAEDSDCTSVSGFGLTHFAVPIPGGVLDWEKGRTSEEN